MATYLTVQLAARRLGVSPVTIRRWTTTGFLPCARTAGGHRRISTDDIDDLARAIGGSTHLTARRAREREIDTLVETSVALAGELDLASLLAEIAKRMTRLLDCRFCGVSEYDPQTRRVRALAEYEVTGRRMPETSGYNVRAFPLTRQVLEDQVQAVVNVDDPHADTAEVAALRSEGDRSLLMLPLVYRGDSIGLLEVIDDRRARKYSRQELRLCAAVAGQAAVALHNARVFAETRRGEQDITRLRETLTALAPLLSVAFVAGGVSETVEALAGAVCDSLPAVACVVSAGGVSAGVARPAAVGDAGAHEDEADGDRPAPRRGEGGHVLVAGDTSGRSGLTITATLAEPAAEGVAEILDLVAAVGSAAVTSRPPAGD